MFKYLTALAILLNIGLLAPAKADDLLATIDRLRVTDGQMRVMTQIDLYEHGELSRSSLYEVYADDARRSLALFRSDAEAGQKVLMLDDQFYLFLPNSRRQIRITPMQKLLGDASTGDISSLRWSEDYRIDEQHTQEDGTLQLKLSAARRGLSYGSVELVVDADTAVPISATFYLPSGRVAKNATFEMGVDKSTGDVRLLTMILEDRIQTAQRTEVHYLSVEPWNIPEPWFNPAFLLRNNL
ncbi:outer membrane lipoprotein-sorting protein [Salinispirillum sp. LH 10-3-1]|uniref:Outer membrane lipoprotein-sorting protein n=1 Tax=Salinispirillum sp. LH 10-3-1 TaxID=2952525 RepID=A0AB38YD02_9GAMM